MFPDHVHLELFLEPPGQAVRTSVRLEGIPDGTRTTVRQQIESIIRTGRRNPESSSDAAERAPRTPTREIHVGLTQPYEDPHFRDDMIAAIRSVVEQGVGDEALTDETCVCASDVPGGQIGLTEDQIAWFDANGAWVPPPDGGSQWRIKVNLDPRAGDQCLLLLSYQPGLTNEYTRIGLSNATGWAKEIWADNLCSGRSVSVTREGDERTFARMLINRPHCRDGVDTIVFRKPGAFGIWTDYAHMPPENFWQAFRCTQADFIWARG